MDFNRVAKLEFLEQSLIIFLEQSLIYTRVLGAKINQDYRDNLN